MKPSAPMLNTWVLVCGSCMAWIGGITFALAYFFELTPPAAWVIASSLSLSATIAITFIFRELRNAIVLPDNADPLEYDMLPIPKRKDKRMTKAKSKHVSSFAVARENF
jgi:hypothetical protein